MRHTVILISISTQKKMNQDKESWYIHNFVDE